MAIRGDIIEILSECIDRLNSGEDIDTILSDYPDAAGLLRPMLEAGQLMPRARYESVEVAAAESALEPIIRQTASDVFGGGLSFIGWVPIVLILLIGGGIAVGIFNENNVEEPSEVILPVTETQTMTATTTPSITPTLSITPTATNTLAATPTPTLTLTASATHTEAAATPTTSPTPQPTDTNAALRVVEGPVTAIEDNTIRIYDLPFTLDDDDPVLQVIQIGDVVRVTDNQAGDISITFISVTVVVQGDRVWRGDDCAVPPPEWAAPNAGDWYERCTAPASPASSGGQPAGDDTNDDDGDDGDDDGAGDDDPDNDD